MSTTVTSQNEELISGIHSQVTSYILRKVSEQITRMEMMDAEVTTENTAAQAPYQHLNTGHMQFGMRNSGSPDQQAFAGHYIDPHSYISSANQMKGATTPFLTRGNPYADAVQIPHFQEEASVKRKVRVAGVDDLWKQGAVTITEVEDKARRSNINIPEPNVFTQHRRINRERDHGHQLSHVKRHNDSAPTRSRVRQDMSTRKEHESSLKQKSLSQMEGQPLFYGSAACNSIDTDGPAQRQPTEYTQSFLANASPPRGRI